MNLDDQTDELVKQVDHLAETLRIAATELLGITDKINKAYKKYAEYVTALQEAANEEGPNPQTEMEFAPDLTGYCPNCRALVEPGSTICIRCGEQLLP